MSKGPNFKDGTAAAEIAAMVEHMIRWTAALHGAGCLRETLAQLAPVTGARVMLVYRACLANGPQRAVASIDLGAARGGRPLVRALGPALIQADPAAATPGSLWTLGEMEAALQDRLDARVLRWMEDRGLRDAAVIPLSLSGDRLDLFEFYTIRPMSARTADTELLGRMLATGWARRSEGRIAALLQADRAIGFRPERTVEDADPLALSNPWGLTAAEMRICALIRSGTDPADVGRHLAVSASTIRSHLRSIYAKGQVSGQVGLIRRLLDRGRGPVKRDPLAPKARSQGAAERKLSRLASL